LMKASKPVTSEYQKLKIKGGFCVDPIYEH